MKKEKPPRRADARGVPAGAEAQPVSGFAASGQERAGSVKQAAALMGIPVEVLKAAKAAGCPGFDDHHRVDMPLVREWMADPANRELVDVSPVVRKAIAEARKEEALAERVEFRNELERGKHIAKAEMAARLVKLAAEQSTVLRQKLENELPALLAGKPIEAMKEECRRVVDQLHTMMQGLVREWAGEPPGA